MKIAKNREMSDNIREKARQVFTKGVLEQGNKNFERAKKNMKMRLILTLVLLNHIFI